MNRIATSMRTSSHQTYLRELEAKKAKLQNKISGEEKNLTLDENPAASGLSSKYRSDLNRINGYMTNISRVQGENQLIHSQLQEFSNVMIRAKELVVQSANSTYTSEDLKTNAQELDQIINFMLDIGNLADENGNAMFAGTQKANKAFEGFLGRVPGASEPMVTQVNYMGNHISNQVSIDQGKNIDLERAGSRIFWGAPESVYGANNGGNYRVLDDSTIYVNGQEIQLRAGDNIHSIVARINGATISVTAKVDLDNSLAVQGNRSEQLLLADGPNSTVLQDLGLIVDGGIPPYNISPYAQKEGGNVFNQLIDIRNMMLKGDTDSLGTRGLRTMDQAHSSIVNNLASIGSQVSRLDAMSSALSIRELNIAQANQEESIVTDSDRTEMILEYKHLDNVHTATLQSAAKALSPSLLDFLR